MKKIAIQLLALAMSVSSGFAQAPARPSGTPATQNTQGTQGAPARQGGQQATAASRAAAEEVVVRLVADRIINDIKFGFVGTTSGKTYTSAKEIPAGEQVRLAHEQAGWGYTNGVLNIALLDLSDYLKDPKYAEWVKRHLAQGLENYKEFQARAPQGGNQFGMLYRQIHTMRELDDCGAMGASVLELMNRFSYPQYREYVDRAANHVFSVQVRMADGTLARTFPNNLTLWADDLYMSVPLLARMGRLTGDKKYFDDALRQVFQFTKYLWDAEDELYHHGWFDDLKCNAGAYWGRCNGWIMVAQVQLLNILPKDHPQREALINNLRRQLMGIMKYQNGKGVWHQILDKNDSYAESSASAMFVYCIARAINEGWLDRRYATVATAGWNGIKREFITETGDMKNVCPGTGIENDLVFYYSRPARTNELHGLGALLEAGLEMIRLRASGITR